VTRRSAPLLAVLLTLSVLLAGCGGGSGVASGGNGSSGGAGAGTSTSQPSGGAQSTLGAATADCPTGGNTKDFAKTRFVLHAAEAFGVFHRYLYKPYRNGAFRKGASGRIRTFLKAGAAALFIKRQVRLATEDAKGNPTLCKAISAPLMQVRDSISGAVSQLRNGDVSGIEALNGVVGGIQGKASRNGISIPDSTTATP